tara:strand:- start:3522 stop:4277 length:756 start_codon:yes stop_codon:yes gene_type:complete
MLLFSSSLLCQEKNFKTLVGEVINDTIDVSGIHVINGSSGGKTITDKDGYFKVGVRKNDSIFFTSVQIKTQMIIIEETVFKSDSIRVYLEPIVNQLESVTVSPNNLSGDLLADMKQIKEKEVFNFDDAGIPGFKGERKEKIVYKNSSSVLVSVILLPLMPLDVDAVYKQLSGYYKTLRSARKLESRSGTAVDIIQFYGVDFFIDSYDLNINSVYEFVLGSMENYDVEVYFRNSNHNLVLTSFKNFYESINN